MDSLSRTMFEQAGIGIALVEPAGGRLLRCNQALSEILGYSVDELCQMTVHEIRHPEDRAIDAGDWESLLAGRIKRYQVEKRYLGKDGRVAWGLLTATLVHTGLDLAPVVMGMMEDITERKRIESGLRATERQLHVLVGRLNSAREEEAKRIARELHDDLGEQLTLLAIELEELERKLPPPDSEQKEHLARMREAVNATTALVQKISGELRTSQLDILGLREAIEWQLQEFTRRSGIRHRLVRLDEASNLSEAQNTALFRILQEALTNVIRHARATEVEVTLQQEKDGVALKISDDGRGITEAELADQKSIGLLGMRERAHIAGGEIAVSGGAGVGTTVRVRVPASGNGTAPG